MRLERLGVRLIVPAVLIGLVGWLAALEYHWLDQVSQADREARRTSLQAHAEEFATDFDRELSRLSAFLQSAGPTVATGVDPAFAKRYEAWHDAARDPQILRGLYWLRGGNATTPASVEEYRVSTQTFAPVSWPDVLAPLKPPPHPADPIAVLTVVPFAPDSVNAQIPAVISPITLESRVSQKTANTFVAMTVSQDRLVAYLDKDYLSTTILPALAARYFPPTSGDPYRLAVIDPTHGNAPIMTANWPTGTAVDPKVADASVALFTYRTDLANAFFQRAQLNSSARPTTPPAGGRGGGGGGGRGGAVATLAPTIAADNLLSAAQASRSTFNLVVQTQGSASTTVGGNVSVGRLMAQPNHWQLVLQHSAGSLDAAVTQARRRNLWLSFGLLSVLTAGVVLIVTTARRSERLATQQMDFVATVSHELRTPIAVIRAAAQNLSAGVVDDPARAKQYGELIEAEGRRLTEMVEQVLDYAGLGTAPRPFASRLLDVGAIALDVVASCRPLAAASGVEFETAVAPDLPLVMGDDAALRSAIQNLVSNAIKYGADGRWVKVTVEPGPRYVSVVVADRGLGIEASDRAHLFEPFYRGQRAKDTQVHGNGLGLSLVKRIAEGHAGQVTVESSPGEGARFTLTIPVAPDVPGLDPVAAT